ncbi:endonuclease/exonuclease/phosphatase family protein [Weeksellaceae bacterium KMM 9713]|uniref:Endonuclease/exonuclease/phosphatase family protein n=1 Tax=Profundicola chukchiensis TaxID=2961959 RepID=A0A9X4MZ08_9FLAO|nr:endonuclease/exonuclease/phosphatase family protein [Profundicola chukchiensis]MDG4944936.1 endonuclease/exonuclease/phosphatase family protein [Profundicola chukchiensis]
MKSILILLHFGLLAAAYAVVLNQWIQPSIFPYFNLLSLGFPVLMVLNLILLVFWWFYRWKIAFVFTLLSLCLAIPLNKIVHIYGEPETTESNLKLISYNVQYFFQDAEGIMKILKDENADVIFIQEMGPGPEGIIENSTNDKAYFFENYNSLGIASKYPIIETQSFRLDHYPTTYTYADIALPNDTVRFITFYLESLHIDQEQIKDPNVDSERIKNNFKTLSSKVLKTAKIHEKQIDAIRENIKSSPYPVVLAGDMNAVPSSYEYYALKRGKKDAFLYGDKVLGTTFPSFGVPLRLDFVFVPEKFKIKSHRIEPVPYSDHYPVIVEIQIP